MNSVSENGRENNIMVQNILQVSLFELLWWNMVINNVTFKIVEQNKCINYEFDEQRVKTIPMGYTNSPSDCETAHVLVLMTDWDM